MLHNPAGQPAADLPGYDALPVPVWLLDGSGTVQGENAAARTLTGQRLIGQPFLQAIHPDDHPAPPDRAPAAWSGHPRLWRLHGHGGQPRYHRLNAAPASAHAADAWMIVGTDVHDQHERERHLSQQRATLQDLLDANADCIKVLDLNGRLLSMNAGGMHVMEVDDFRTCLLHDWPTFWEGETQALVHGALNAARAGQVRTFEGRCATMKGTMRWWEVTVGPIYDDARQIVNLLATSRDITARKDAEQQLRDLNASLEERVHSRTEALGQTVEQLRRSNTELERFAYIAAHDLQEPIRTVHSFTEMLEARYRDQLDDRGQQYLGLISRGARRMKSLVDDLLRYSRLTHQRPPMVPVPAALPLHEALANLEHRLTEKAAQVHAGDLPTVLGDAPQLVQVFQNLIGNAVKFSRAGHPPHVQVSAQRDGPDWQFTVQDNGIGIEEAYLQRVFEMFRRLHGQDQFEGTGLGLALCRKIIEAHGGRIWVRSVPGEGSAFHFTLPAAPVRPPSA